jgi:hypothetical protein
VDVPKEVCSPGKLERLLDTVGNTIKWAKLLGRVGGKVKGAVWSGLGSRLLTQE